MLPKVARDSVGKPPLSGWCKPRAAKVWAHSDSSLRTIRPAKIASSRRYVSPRILGAEALTLPNERLPKSPSPPASFVSVGPGFYRIVDSA